MITKTRDGIQIIFSENRIQKVKLRRLKEETVNTERKSRRTRTKN